MEDLLELQQLKEGVIVGKGNNHVLANNDQQHMQK